MVLKTSSKKRPHIVLSVNGNLRKEVAVVPAKLAFGTVNTAGEEFNTRNLVKTATIRDIRGDGFEVKKVKSSGKWMVAEVEPHKEKKQYTLRVTLDKDALPQGIFSETITVYTSYKKKPLVIDVKGEIL